MFSDFYYPIISTPKFSETVGFYEDHLEYELAFEMDNFAILKRCNLDDVYLGIIDSSHDILPEPYQRPTNGLVLNYPVENTNLAYQQFYWEGLNILSEPVKVPCGRKYFLIEDPNGNLINVTQDVPIDTVISAEDFRERCVVQTAPERARKKIRQDA